jgi:hypothetical protein
MSTSEVEVTPFLRVWNELDGMDWDMKDLTCLAS